MKKGKKYDHPSYSGVFECMYVAGNSAWVKPVSGKNPGFITSVNGDWTEKVEPVNRFVNLYWNQNTRSFSTGVTHGSRGDAERLVLEKEGCFLVDTLSYEVGKYAEANPPSKRK